MTFSLFPPLLLSPLKVTLKSHTLRRHGQRGAIESFRINGSKGGFTLMNAFWLPFIASNNTTPVAGIFLRSIVQFTVTVKRAVAIGRTSDWLRGETVIQSWEAMALMVTVCFDTFVTANSLALSTVSQRKVCSCGFTRRITANSFSAQKAFPEITTVDKNIVTIVRQNRHSTVFFIGSLPGRILFTVTVADTLVTELISVVEMATGTCGSFYNN
jgi:hypothetical protein